MPVTRRGALPAAHLRAIRPLGLVIAAALVAGACSSGAYSSTSPAASAAASQGPSAAASAAASAASGAAASAATGGYGAVGYGAGGYGAAASAAPSAPAGAAPTTAPAASIPPTVAPTSAPAATPAPTRAATPAPSPSSPASSAGVTLKTASSSSLGTYLTDGKGMTLYLFKSDTDGSPPTSACTSANGCDRIWPPLTVTSGERVTAGSGVTGKITTFKRPSGALQVAYNGIPLYYYVGDSAPGQTNGQGYGGLWYVVKP